MEPIKFSARVIDVIQKVSKKEASLALQATSLDDLRKKPVISVTLLLAVLDVKNLNGHYLPLEEANKMVEALSEHPYLPGNCNHDMVARATSILLWVEEFTDTDGEKRSGLYLKGVLWNSYFDDQLFAKIYDDFSNGKLGASWEMNIYVVDSEKKEDGSIVLKDFIMNGWGLILSDTQPAENRTKGTVQLAASVNEGIDQAFWDRHLHVLQAELEMELVGKALTYEERQALPDSDFALIRHVKDSEGNDIKERHFPIDDESRRKVVLSFLKKSKQFTGEEKIAIFKKALAKGKKEGDKWVTKYDSWDTSVFPPKPPKKEGVMGKSATRNLIPTWYADDNYILRLFENMPCPTCSSHWGEVKTVDYENGVAELECGGDDDGNKHRFEVAITVKSVGGQQEAKVAIEYRVVAKDNEATYIKKEVKRMPEFTDEQIEDMKKKAAVDAIDSYKSKVKLGAARADDISKLVPFESEVKRLEAVEKYAEMTDEQYLIEKKEKVFDRKEADYQAKIAELEKAKDAPPVVPDTQVNAGLGIPKDPLKDDEKPKESDKKEVKVDLAYAMNF